MPQDDSSTGAVSAGRSTSTVRADGAQLQPGQRIGHYKILEQIGEGGFAIVYLAEQEKPVRRRVALKIIKLGMDTKQVIARFEAERQALAMMDHPNVAKVFDAGATDTGRPYFVMEYVPGKSITDYCDRHRLTTRQRLELFTQACESMQHAHQKGIIHRDIKPTNVLVSVKDGTTLVKVIDFGVAKAISQRLTEKTIYTEQGQLIGTPEYMSPEQAEMSEYDIDTRSDIYSLGVLLYELLVGALPFDPRTLRQAAFGEIQRIIREEEPAKPSTRLSSLGDESTAYAQKRRADPKSLLRELRGDLDWIVMKALEKDRSRRYETANGLAMDIQRHLNHEPVLASPPSPAYKLSKFVRRNRTGVLAGAVVAAALVVATGVSIGFAVSEGQQRQIAETARTEAQDNLKLAREQEQKANASRDEAEKQTQRAEESHEAEVEQRQKAEREAAERSIANALLVKMVSSLEPNKGSKEVLEEIASDAQDSLNQNPSLRAAVEEALGYVHWGIGDYKNAEVHLRSAVALRRDQKKPDELSQSLRSLAGFLSSRSEFDESVQLLREDLERQRRSKGSSHVDTVRATIRLGVQLHNAGELGAAEPLLRQGASLSRSLLGSGHPDTLIAISRLGYLLLELDQVSEAQPLLREAVDRATDQYPEGHWQTWVFRSRLGECLARRGEFREAEMELLAGYDGLKETLGRSHSKTRAGLDRVIGLYKSWSNEVLDKTAKAALRSLLAQYQRQRRVSAVDDPNLSREELLKPSFAHDREPYEQEP